MFSLQSFDARMTSPVMLLLGNNSGELCVEIKVLYKIDVHRICAG